jgi:hypothetical protein
MHIFAHILKGEKVYYSYTFMLKPFYTFFKELEIRPNSAFFTPSSNLILIKCLGSLALLANFVA